VPDHEPEPFDCVVRIAHFNPVPEELRRAIREGGPSDFVALLVGHHPKLILRYADVDYTQGLPLEREQNCLLQREDFLLIVQSHGDHFERIGSLDGGLLDGFMHPLLRKAEKKRFRLG
jgi:hypothetical protein